MKILIVDDEGTNRKLLRGQLEVAGHSVVEAADGVEALGVLKAEQVDGIISDILMPNMDGYRLCVEVRKDPKMGALPFVIYTATFTSSGDEHFAQEVGADGYFRKPTRLEVLVAALEIAATQGRGRLAKVLKRGGELLLVKDYSELLVRKLDEKHRSLEAKSAELQRSEERNRLLAAVVDSTDDVIVSMSPDGTILSWNKGAARLSGYEAGEVIGKDRSLLIPSSRPDDTRDLMDRVKQGESPPPFETVRSCKDGSILDVSVRLSPIKDSSGEVVGISAIARDISAQKEMERKLTAAASELRAVSARLETIRENEAIRIARAVHDELGQNLTALNMDLVWLQKKVGGLPDGPQVALMVDRVKTMSQLIAETVATVQRIAGDLRPGALDDLGLTAALEWYAEEFQKRSGIPCRWTEKTDLPGLSKETATALFRIFQETLTNIGRHAGATEVTMALREEADSVMLEVADNGIGFAAEQFTGTKSLGLLGMRERALLIGGTVNIQSAIGKGTRVVIAAPNGKAQ